MAWKSRLKGESLSSLFLALLSIGVWQGIIPLVDVSGTLKVSWVWGDLFGFIVVGGSYYAFLTFALYLARRLEFVVNPISQAYVAGWWIIIITAVLGVYSPVFNDILGMSLGSKGAIFLFLTLTVGLLRFWRESYLRSLVEKPPGVEEESKQMTKAERDTSD